MRLALFSWEARHAVAVGGVAVHVSALAATFARREHEVHVFTRLGPGQRLADNVLGVYYHRCPFEPQANFVDEMAAMGVSFAHYFRQAETESGAFDVVHCHDWLAAAAGLRLRREELGARLAMTFHTTEWGRSGSWPETDDARRIAAIEGDAIQAADAVITVSHAVRRQLDSLYTCPDWKTATIYNGVDPAPFDRFPFDPGAVKQRLQLAPLAPTVLFVGRLSPRKGPDLLLEAAPRVLEEKPEARFLFVGEGELRDHLENEAGRYGIREAVRFLGWREGAELIDLYRACDLVCAPSRSDPFGIVPLSAWAAGKPVVATAAGCPGEFIHCGSNGLLVEATPAAVAAAILELFSDFDRLRWMGRNGRVAVETAFTWEVVAEKTLALYARQQTLQ